MVFLAFFHTIKSRWMNLFFMLLPIIGSLLDIFFQFNGVEICPTLEKFSAIIGEPSMNDLVFPTIGGDLPTPIQALWVLLLKRQSSGMFLAS